MEDALKEKINEDWKARVEKDKKIADDKKQVYHQPTFSVFISSLSMQAMIALGKLENPLTKKTEKNLGQARFLIDTVAIIEEKTKGNLSADEAALLEESLYNLRMLYIEESYKL